MKKKLKNLSNTLVVLLLSFTLIACSGETTSNQNSTGETGKQDSVDLLFGSWIPATHFANAEAIVPWADYVKEKSDGTVSIEVKPGAVLGGSQQVIQDVSGGVYDIGFTAPQYYADTPLYKMTILDLPFAFINTTDHLTSSKIAQRFVDEYVKDEFEKMGVKLIGVYHTDPTKILSTKPIKSIDDVKGKKIMIQGFKSEDIIKAWGGTPVAISVEDMYTGLDRGTIDTTLIAPTGVPPHKVYEPAPYLTNIGISNISLFYVMNLDKYNSLSPELQKQFEDEYNPKIEELISTKYVDTIDESIELIANEGEVIELSDEQISEFLKPAKSVWEKWIKEAEDKGYDGQALVDGLWEIMEEEGVEPPFEW